MGCFSSGAGKLGFMRTPGRVAGGASSASRTRVFASRTWVFASRTLAPAAGGLLFASSACLIDDGDDAGGSGLGGGNGVSGSGGEHPGHGGYAGENFPPPPPPPVCGDGLVRSPESCDDSNTVAGDGCDELCQVEQGWRCTVEEGCVSLYGDRACSGDACRDGASCVERGSRIGCLCPSEPPAACEGLRFRALGLPADSDSCAARAVSGDGTTVVGSCTRYEAPFGIVRVRAFRWTRDAGTTDLGLAADKHSEAVAVSRDGSIVVGSERSEQFGSGTGFRVGPEGKVQLGLDFVTAASADGNVVVGGLMVRVDGGFVSSEPAIWTPSGVSRLSTAGLDSDVQAMVISADGSVIGGSGKVGDTLHALRWDSSGVSLLPLPPGGVHGEVGAITADGTIIYGAVSFADESYHVARWTAGGVEDLGAGGANGVSADGSVVLAGQRLWDATSGWRLLRDLSDTNLEGWTELNGAAISDDGKVVVGSSQFPSPITPGVRAFILHVP